MPNIKINYDNIKEIKLIGGRPDDRKTWSQVVKEYPDADYILNGGLFDTASGWSTVDTIQNNEIVNGGNYTNKGFAFAGDTLKMMTTEEAKNNGYDSFLGGGPTLVVNNDIFIDSTGLGNWFCEIGTAIRLGIGINEQKDLIIRWSEDKITLRDLASLMYEEDKCIEAIALDGGGSTNIFAKRDENWEPINNQTENRKVPTWILVYLKKPLTNEDEVIEPVKKNAYFVCSGKNNLDKKFIDEIFIKDFIVGGLYSSFELNNINTLIEDNSTNIKLIIQLNDCQKQDKAGSQIIGYTNKAHYKRYIKELGNYILEFASIGKEETIVKVDDSNLGSYDIVLAIYLDYWYNIPEDYDNLIMTLFIDMITKGILKFEERNLEEYKTPMVWSSYMGLPIAEQDYNLTYNSFLQMMSDFFFITQKKKFQEENK